ncbi:Ribose-phosphate pyrophosphokinase 2 [Perkinsus olseni]|nr:Ribose-phosphate pyrophosphokinase 2 [Perkinsus olseni]
MTHEPSRIASLSLVDPVCFLLVKNDLLLNTQRKAHEDPIGILATYLVFRELYTAHTLTRNLFWEQNNVWPEELRGVPTHVSLCGRDFIIPAHSVRRLLEAEAAARLEITRDEQLNKFRRQQQPLKSRMSGRESLFQPLTVDWNDEGIHGEALNNGHWRRRVLRQIADLMKEK